MAEIYTDGVLRVEIKHKYAYGYNKAGSCIGTWEIEDRRSFIASINAAGFELETEEQEPEAVE